MHGNLTIRLTKSFMEIPREIEQLDALMYPGAQVEWEPFCSDFGTFAELIHFGLQYW